MHVNTGKKNKIWLYILVVKIAANDTHIHRVHKNELKI